jgi:hypothetical protein
MAFAVTVTVTNSATSAVVPSYRLQMCSDAAGATILFDEYTGTAGTYAFSLDAGTYHLFGRGPGYTCTNPTTVVVTAATAVSLEVTALNVYDEGATEICNAALDLLGAGMDDVERLDSYENDTGDTADWFRYNYPSSKKRAILRHDWDGAIDYLLGTDGGSDVSGINHEPYEYAYLIPTTAFGLAVVALRGLVDADDHDKVLKYRTRHGYAHTDYETSDFAWKLLLDIETGFNNGLQQCIEYELAIRAATKFLKGKRGDEKRRMLVEEYENVVLPRAKGQNQQEEYDEPNASHDGLWSEIT